MTKTDPAAPEPNQPKTSPQKLEGEALAGVTSGFGFQGGPPLGPGLGVVPWNCGTWPYGFPVAHEMPDR